MRPVSTDADRSPLVSWALDAGVALVTLRDPARRNILSPRLVADLTNAFGELEAADARVAVITGAGPAFCAGAELAGLEAGSEGDFGPVEEVYRGFLRIVESPVLTIAAVNGPAVGAGMNLALACDARLVAHDAYFEPRFAEMHLHPGGGHIWMLEQAIGRQAATMAVLLGERLDADRAVRLGLAWSAHDPETLTDAAVTIGRRVGQHDPAYLRAVTSTLRTAARFARHDSAVQHERSLQRWSMGQPRFRAAIKALRQRIERRSR